EERRFGRSEPGPSLAAAALELQVGDHRPSLFGTASAGGAGQVLRAATGGLVVKVPCDLAGDQPGAHPFEDDRAHWVAAIVSAALFLPSQTMTIIASIT